MNFIAVAFRYRQPFLTYDNPPLGMRVGVGVWLVEEELREEVTVLVDVVLEEELAAVVVGDVNEGEGEGDIRDVGSLRINKNETHQE